MAQISIIDKNNIIKAHRADAEYFKPFNLKSEKLITSKPFCKLKDIGEFIIGPFGSTVKVEDYVDKKEYKYIRGKDIKNGVLANEDNVAVSREKYNSLPRYHLKNQDLLITVVGTLGNVAIYRDSFGPAIFSCKSTILRPEKINSELLMIFLSTKYGKSLLMRNERGAIQKGFNLPDLKNIPIPIFLDDFEIEILNYVKKSHKKQTQSKELYKEAEQLLLKELSLLNYKPKKVLTFETTSNEVKNTTRFDAEYFHPKYAEIIKHIENYSGGFADLIEFIDTYSTGYPFNSKSYSKNGIYLIRINNIEKGNLNLENAVKIPSSDRYLSEKDFVKKNDILISMSGTIGNACRIQRNVEAMINQRIFKLTPKNYNSEVLTLIINSILGNSQLERIGTGGVQTNISGNDIKRIKIPIIRLEIQKKIADKIQESHKLRKDSKELLETAKRKVEEEIEKDQST